MPFYEYKCRVCGKKFEALRSFGDRDADVSCPHCEAVGEVERLVSVPGRARVPGATRAGRKSW